MQNSGCNAVRQIEQSVAWWKWWIGASCSCGQDRWFAAQPSTPRNPCRGHNCPQNAGNLNPKSSQCIFSTSLSSARLSHRWMQMVTVVCTCDINVPQISHVHSICTMYIYFGVSLQALLVSKYFLAG